MTYLEPLPTRVPGRFYLPARGQYPLGADYPLGDMRPWGITHHHAGAYAQRRDEEQEQTRAESE